MTPARADDLLHLCRNRLRATCSPRTASNSIPCSTLEKISATATTDTAMTGPSVAAIKIADRRRRSPRRRSGASACAWDGRTLATWNSPDRR